MPLDALCLTALKNELSEAITGAKIDKIQQPERDVLIFQLRAPGVSARLLVSAGASDARAHLTELSYENPAAPPMFCMLLRKHITGARIIEVSQPPMERVLCFRLQASDTFGEQCEKQLIVEMMGRFANIILVDEDGIIVDCLRRIDFSTSEKRQVLPGLMYHLPPGQDKRDPTGLSVAELADALSAHAGREPDKQLLDAFTGLSPLICRELALRAGSEAGLASALHAHLADVAAGDVMPYLLRDEDGTPKDFSYMQIMQYGDHYRLEQVSTFSELLEAYYSGRARNERVRQRSAQMTRTVKNAYDRIARKLAVQKDELRKSGDRERLRELGDIITANLHTMQKGMEVLRAQDFYSEDGGECEVRLDPLKTPQQNAAKYYKDYNKAKNAAVYLTEQIEIGEREYEYLGSVLEEIGKAEGERDLAEIRRELISTGYIRAAKTAKKEKVQQSAPLHFTSSSGMEIRVGRNNIQNDELTLKSSSKSDIWLHAQKIHGSHVIISTGGGEADDDTLYEAACLAARYSQAQSSGKVPVDYCLVKHVKKPSGGRPGMVIYTDYKTIIAEPGKAPGDEARRNA